MTIEPLLPYGQHIIDEDDIEAVVRTLRSPRLTQGPAVEVFEQALAKVSGAEYAVVVSSGTAALHLAVQSLDIKKGSSAVTSSISFAASANCFEYCDLKPVFCDIESDSGLMSIEALEAILENRKKAGDPVRLVVPVHYSGQCADMDKLWELKNHYKFSIIEDAAHALGASYSSGLKVGSCSGSDMTILSFHPVKHIATGEGGAVLTNNRKLYEKLKCLRSHGISRDFEGFQNQRDLVADTKGVQNPWYYEMQDLGFNYRMSDVAAALGESQLRKLSGFVVARRKLAKVYSELLRDSELFEVIAGDKYGASSYHLQVVKIKDDGLKLQKATFMKNLARDGVGTQVHYIPIPMHPYYRRKGYSCPEGARIFYESVISVPMFPAMALDHVEKVVAILDSNAKKLIN